MAVFTGPNSVSYVTSLVSLLNSNPSYLSGAQGGAGLPSVQSASLSASPAFHIGMMLFVVLVFSLLV